MADMIIVSATGLTKQYPKCLALDNVSFAIERGQIVGLVGKNGAGKTTLIRILTGLNAPTAGSYSLFGVSDEKELVKIRSKVAAMVETPALYLNMNATDNLMEACILNGVKNPKKSGYIHRLLDFVGLPGSYTDKRKVKNYSLGMRQRMGIAMAMVGEPELMILDEPTNGLDPEGIRQIRDLLQKLNREKGVTIIVSSHILAELEKFATSYIFIDNGRIKEQISAAELERISGKSLTLKTSNNAQAILFLAEKNIVATVSGDTIVVKNLENPAGAINVLSENKITILEMKEATTSLEDHYLGLIGGNH